MLKKGTAVRSEEWVVVVVDVTRRELGPKETDGMGDSLSTRLVRVNAVLAETSL